MEKSKSIILVPYEFTEVAGYAVEHAVVFAERTKSSIYLLNIVKSKNDISDTLIKLKEKADYFSQKFNIEVVAKVRVGSIFSTINIAAQEFDSLLIVMGTHGIRGLQKLTGSWALKVIVGSKIPFFVVQAPPKKNEDKKFVFPVNYKAENKEKLAWVEVIAKIFNTKIYFFTANASNKTFERKTKANLIFDKNFLKRKGIPFELASASGKKSFSTETIEYAKSIDADGIFILTTRDIAFHDYMLGANEQQIIANEEKLPILVINPRTDLMKLGYANF